MYYYLLQDDHGANSIYLECLMFPGAEFYYDDFKHVYKVIRQELDNNNELMVICERVY